jgi:hypothetical protein
MKRWTAKINLSITDMSRLRISSLFFPIIFSAFVDYTQFCDFTKKLLYF